MGVTGNVYASRCGKEKWNLEEEAFSLFIWGKAFLIFKKGVRVTKQ